jgi:hypothetical protein
MFDRSFLSLLAFQNWMQANGYSYLEAGVGSMSPGDAIKEICRRVGIRGIKGNDVIVETLPMIRDLIRLRCVPKR